MEEKAVKDWLYRIRDINSDLEKLYERKEIYLNNIFPPGVRYDKESVQTSPSDTFAEQMFKVVEVSKEIDALVAKRSAAIDEIFDALCMLNSKNERLVLLEYFISRKSMSEVSRAVSLEPRYTYKVKRKGIEHLSKILRNKTVKDSSGM